MAVVGAFARIDLVTPQRVHERLAAVPGVTLFDLGEAAKIGLVIEASDLDDAHRKLRVEIEKIEGVLGVWPVYAHMENELSDMKCQTPG